MDYYKILKQSLSKDFLKEVLRKIKSGENLLYIKFLKNSPGVVIPDFVRHSEEQKITVVLSDFFNLQVKDLFFSVTLSFNQDLHDLVITYDSVVEIIDPSEDFFLHFEINQDEKDPQTDDYTDNIIQYDFSKNKK